MRLTHMLVLAGALGVAGCAPGTAGTESTAVEGPFYADAYDPFLVREPGGYTSAPLYARPLPRHGYGAGHGLGFHARERWSRELEWRQRREFAREQRLGLLFERPPGSRRDPFAGPRSDAFRNQTRVR